MDRELLRNGSGYVDFTAYQAMTNYQKEINKMQVYKKAYCRGEIFDYETAHGNYRKALIVSADFRSKDRFLNGILLSEEPKGGVNVPIVCQGMMYADCGMVSICADEKLGDFVKAATDAEMKQIDEGIAKCLGIESVVVEKEVIKEVPVAVPGSVQNAESVEELTSAKAEAKVYKDLYESLLAKVMK